MLSHITWSFDDVTVKSTCFFARMAHTGKAWELCVLCYQITVDTIKNWSFRTTNQLDRLKSHHRKCPINGNRNSSVNERGLVTVIHCTVIRSAHVGFNQQILIAQYTQQTFEIWLLKLPKCTESVVWLFPQSVKNVFAHIFNSVQDNKTFCSRICCLISSWLQVHLFMNLDSCDAIKVIKLRYFRYR